jgi:hypothetical protein
MFSYAVCSGLLELEAVGTGHNSISRRQPSAISPMSNSSRSQHAVSALHLPQCLDLAREKSGEDSEHRKIRSDPSISLVVHSASYDLSTSLEFIARSKIFPSDRV